MGVVSREGMASSSSQGPEQLEVDPETRQVLEKAPPFVRKAFGDLALVFYRREGPGGNVLFVPCFGRFEALDPKAKKLISGHLSRGDPKMQQYRQLLLDQLMRSRALALQSPEAIQEYRERCKKCGERVVMGLTFPSCTPDCLDDPRNVEAGWETLSSILDQLIRSGQERARGLVEDARRNDVRAEKIMITCLLKGMGTRESPEEHFCVYLVDIPDESSFFPSHSDVRSPQEEREDLLSKCFS